MRRKVSNSTMRFPKSSQTTPALGPQDAQAETVPDASIFAAVVLLDVPRVAQSSILTLPIGLRQMIYSYVLPSEQRLLLPLQAKWQRVCLVRRMKSIHMLHGFIDLPPINTALLQIYHQFRVEAILISIRQNTVFILVFTNRCLERKIL